jgi:hypothetical protein
MRRILFIGMAVIAILVAAGFAAMHFLMTPPDDLDLARSRPTDGGLYIATIEPEAGSIRQNELHSWVVTLETAGGAPVEDAAIAIDGGMPQHGHGLPTNPQVTSHLGEGRYRVEGVRFNMSGWWEFKLAISAPQGQDQVTFNLTL